ncbi:hypothetical protein FRC12_008361 [Ceratobasidium sp. 428]|nr:hypothetical protein FRC12_008361 [Ceratobasidium sp. 428]
MSTTPAPSFDFVSTLSALDPYHTYAAAPLLGGLNNLTSRITISPKPNSKQHQCPFGQRSNSAVAKYAPPYVAVMGDSTPFSQFRQVNTQIFTQSIIVFQCRFNSLGAGAADYHTTSVAPSGMLP